MGVGSAIESFHFAAEHSRKSFVICLFTSHRRYISLARLPAHDMSTFKSPRSDVVMCTTYTCSLDGDSHCAYDELVCHERIGLTAWQRMGLQGKRIRVDDDAAAVPCPFSDSLNDLFHHPNAYTGSFFLKFQLCLRIACHPIMSVLSTRGMKRAIFGLFEHVAQDLMRNKFRVLMWHHSCITSKVRKPV